MCLTFCPSLFTSFSHSIFQSPSISLSVGRSVGWSQLTELNIEYRISIPNNPYQNLMQIAKNGDVISSFSLGLFLVVTTAF